MSKKDLSDVIVPDLKELEAFRASITTRDDLVEYLEFLTKDLERDDHDRDKPQIVFLAEMEETVGGESLFNGRFGEKLPETPSWKTFGDIMFDVFYHL